MAIHHEIPQVSFAVGKAAVLAAVTADIPVLLLGDPGLGKSALVRYVAEEVGLPLVTLLGSTLDPTDIGGALVVNKNKDGVTRVPLEIIRRACQTPCLLFLDEISTAPPIVQAALLRLILERVAGDSPLHPGTRVVSAANPPEQSPGGFELSAPLMGRLTVLHLRPSADEVLEWFATLGEPESELNAQARDFAATAKFMPELLQIDIPSGCVSGNIPWGSPRSWERAVRARAAAVTLAPSVMHALTAGAVGDDIAAAYAAVISLRDKLPTVEEIVADPKAAKVPTEIKHQIAAIGVTSRVAAKNTWAAWVFAERLQPEIAAACAHGLLRTPDSPTTAPHAIAGVSARVKLTAGIMGGK